MACSGLRRAVGRGGGLGRPRFSSQFTRIGGAVIRVGGAVIRAGGAVIRIGGAVTRIGGAVTRAGGAVTRIDGAVTRAGGAAARTGGAVTRAGVIRGGTCSRRRGGSGSISRSGARGIGGPAGLRATCGAMARGDFGTIPPPDECHWSPKSMSF